VRCMPPEQLTVSERAPSHLDLVVDTRFGAAEGWGTGALVGRRG
jgi:hypothetical protein